MSCLLCCFKTLSLCGLRDCLITNAAFRPPSERKYELTLERQDLVKGSVFKMLIQESDDSKFIGQDIEGLESCIVWLDTKTNKKIPALFIDNQNCKSNFVILYSHGNSTDLGRMFKPLQELSQALNVHVFAYEYNGYGPTQGSPGEYEVIFGIMAAYEYLTQRLCFKWQNIILYGRSIGSGPSVFLASHPNYPVSGVILHSPIASGLRVFKFHTQTTDKTDLFPNCDFIEHAKAHVFIIHGEADAEVPVAHGHLLASKCRNLYSPWWVSGGNHNDIDYTFRRAYFLRIAKFLKHVRDFNLEKSNTELDQFYRVGLWHHQSSHIYIRKVKEIEEKYEKTVKENGKKTLHDTSFLSGTSLMTQKSLRDKMINDIKDEKDPKDFNLASLEYDETEAGGHEGKIYLPPNLPSKSFSLKKQNKNLDLEANTVSLSGNIKELELIEEPGKGGPRQVKFQSMRVDSKGDTSSGITERDTTEGDEKGEAKGVL